ncbi:MAG: UdgX family uracil-DNA binding protein [Alsobacter sp.]
MPGLLAPPALRVRLSGPADAGGFRDMARALLARGVPPERILWETGEREADLLAGDVDEGVDAVLQAAPVRAAPRVGRAFLDQAEAALLHRDPARFALVYRVLWRLHDEPGLLSLASDRDVARIAGMAKAVRREIHKMHAFVRFRDIATVEGERFVAWYEPEHFVEEAAAPFFAKRFASLAWSILTPRRSVHWTGERLVFGTGASRRDAPDDDALEALWRSYYANIFNPARVNPDAMRAEMPKRFWRNLPEAALIRGLVAEAPARAARMVEAAPTLPVARRGAEATAGAGEPGAVTLADAVRGCRRCPLWEPATQGVPGQGPAGARIMLVGEQPGDQEDLAGRPFVGPAGQVLDRALGEAGLDRAGLYLTNAVKHFKFAPRGKRRIHKRPSSGEIEACLPWLVRELAEVDPAVVVMLGASAAEAILGRSVAVTQMRGRPFRMPDGRTGLVATHPAYILRLEDRDAAREAYGRLVADLAMARQWAQDRPREPL